MSGVLVLNATFEPLAVVSARRAVCLVLAEKVEMLHAAGLAFRSERRSVEVPSVVRLSHYVSVPRPRHRSPNRRAVFARDRDSCQYCGDRAETMDHVVPRSRGGKHTWENVVAACRRCNAKKRDRLPSESGMRLRRRPEPPSPSTWVEIAAGGVPDAWTAYLQPRNDLRTAGARDTGVRVEPNQGGRCGSIPLLRAGVRVEPNPVLRPRDGLRTA